MNPKDLDRCKSVLKLYLKISDTFYESQQNTGAKFTKGRLKFRKDVKESITTALQLIDKYEQYEGCIMKDIIDENQDLKDILLTRDHCIKTQGEEIGRLKYALKGVIHNLGVPQPGYPAPVAEAYEIAKNALEVTNDRP